MKQHVPWLARLVRSSLVWLAVASPMPAAAADNPHPLQDPSLVTVAVCALCHAGEPTGSGGPELREDAASACTSCHPGGDESHEVGMQPDFAVPADLPLDAGGRMTCLTCHFAHGPLRGDRPWCSVSLLDRMLGSERLTKTFLLRRNNATGELCLACHDTGESK